MKRVYEILAAFFASPPQRKIEHKTIGSDPDIAGQVASKVIKVRAQDMADSARDRLAFHDVRRAVASTLLCPHDIPSELPCRACVALRTNRKPL